MLSSESVRHELTAFGCVKFEVTLHGFELLGDHERVVGTDGCPAIGKHIVWRLTHGGGISGEGDRVWWLERKDGQPHENQSKKVTTRRDLRRLLREWMTDEPKPSEDHAAKLVENRHGAFFVWVKKPRH